MTNAGRVWVGAGALVASIALAACADTTRPPAAAPVAPIDRGEATRAIDRTLDDLHDAAAHADEARYFAHFADDAVFLGTDGTERWTLPAFRAFAHPFFAKGKAWSFHAVRRATALSDDGGVAWFDEDLATEKLGPSRGSGVLVLRGGAWKVAQYNLTTVIPNERFAEVRALLDRPATASSASPFEERFKRAYSEATSLATRGEIPAAERVLASLVDEAEAREGDDSGFWLHNELTWLRWAEGDLAGALREVDGAKSALLRARITPAEKSARTGLHEKWDRAYLLVELAREAPPTLRAKAIAAADAARADYERAAAPLNDHDGMAVLAAFFAVRASDAKGALAAAKRVDAEKDGDMQDIYVLALAYEAAGDRAKAEALRQRVRAADDYLLKPLLVRQIEADAARATKSGRR